MCSRVTKVRRSSAVGVELPSGRVAVATGTYCSPRGGEFAFRGLLLPNRYCAAVVAVVLGKHWRPRGLVDRLTVLRVIRPSAS